MLLLKKLENIKINKSNGKLCDKQFNRIILINKI